MKTLSRPLLAGWLATLLLGGCVADSAKTPAVNGKVTPQMRSGSAELRAYQLMDWIAPDDRTMVVNTADRSLYSAHFKGRCNGVRQADTVAFIIPEAAQFDKYAGIVLPDGTHCAFGAITKISTAPDTTSP